MRGIAVNLAMAHALFEESLLLWKELGDRKAVARALSNLAIVVNSQGDYSRARELYAECLAIFEALGDRTGVAWSLNHQGDAAREQGDWRTARTFVPAGAWDFSGPGRSLGDRRNAGGFRNAGARAARLRDGAVFASRKLDYVSRPGAQARDRAFAGMFCVHGGGTAKCGAVVKAGGGGGGVTFDDWRALDACGTREIGNDIGSSAAGVD